MIAISATSNSRFRTTRLNSAAGPPLISAKANLSVCVRNCLVTG